MSGGPVRTYLAECFWPGVTEAALYRLDERVQASVQDLAGRGEAIRYLGSLLIYQDEVVLCRFEGAEPPVRRAAQDARIPYDRILESASSPWPSGLDD